jgi:hypothetical protein
VEVEQADSFAELQLSFACEGKLTGPSLNQYTMQALGMYTIQEGYALMVTDTARIIQQVRDQTFDSVQQGQRAAATTAQALSETWISVIRQFVPSVYDAGRSLSFDPSDIIDRMFTFSERLLGVQREFAHQMIQAAVPALRATEKAAAQVIGQVDERSERIQEHAFIFRSPEGEPNACAQSLASFARLANLVDDATWLYHLRRRDYSRWFQDVIHDEVLACETTPLEGPGGASAEDSRQHITQMIVRRYPMPA